VTYKDVIEAFAAVRGESLVVAGPGVSSRLLWAAQHRPVTLYQMELGYPTAMCLGLALAAPEQRVVALEGDGSMLAGLGVLTTIARYAPANLVVLVLDNGRYGTVGSGAVETATRTGTDFVAVATACGWKGQHARRVSTIVDARAALRAALSEAGPWLIVASVDGGTLADARGVGQIPFDIVEAAINFRRAMIDRGHA
jgi:thiamine pyrophosphate-dependent acetolactate synthase large subunit-like protein